MTDEEFGDYFLPAIKNLMLHLPADAARAKDIISLLDELIPEDVSDAKPNKSLTEESKGRLHALAGPNFKVMIEAMRAKDKVL